MPNFVIAMLLKPFVALFFLLAMRGTRRATQRYVKDGKLKRLLLWRVRWPQKAAGSALSERIE